MTRHRQLVRSGLVGLALGVGLGGVAGGCGGPSGSGPGAGTEPVPEGFVKAKEAMKERAAAQKGFSGGMKGARGGR